MKQIRWRPAPKVHARAYFFTVNVADDGAIVVQQIAEEVATSNPQNESLMMLHFSETEAVALHLTWLNGKPAPNTAMRTRGLLAVYGELQRLVPELQNSTIGIGHADGAEVEWDT